MITAAVKFFLAAIALGVLAPATSATAPEHGTMELCERLHVITVNNYTDGIMVKYKNSHSSGVLTTMFQDHYLPPLSICGDSYKRCNIHITSNYDGSIRVAMFPLSSGIGLISYDHLTDEDTLLYREQFVLTPAFPDCTYMYFTQTREVVGYCLDLYSRDQPYMYSLRIGIQHDNLNRSIVRQHNSGESIELYNLASLSNFVFFDSDRDPVDRCFSDEDGHIVCLENGEVLDHSFSGEVITPYDPHISTCSSASVLSHVGTTCKLVAHCSDKVFLFKIHQDQPTVLSDGSSGQVYVCPDLQLVKFRNGTLSLHAENGTNTGKFVSFPHERIHQGDCLIINQHYVFFATLVDGRTLLTNFSSLEYWQLGVSGHAMDIPSSVKHQIGLVHNGSDTLVYNLSLPCQQEPMVIPNNFILANYFSTGTKDRCWCPTDSGPSTSIHQATVAPTFEKNSLGLVISLSVVLPVTFAVIVVVVLLLGVLLLIVRRKHKRSNTSTSENGIQHLHIEDPLIQNNNNMSGVKLDVLNSNDQKSNSDQKSTTPESDSGGSLDTTDPLLDSESRLDSSCLPKTQNLNLLNDRNQLMLQLRPESTLSACTSETTNSSSEYVHGYQALCLSPQSTGDRETSVGVSVNCTEDCDGQQQPASSGFQYPHRRLREVGQANTMAIQCTSPRNSYHGNSTHAGAGSPQHASNVVVISQRPSVNGSVAGQSESSDATDNIAPLHPSPIEATSDGNHGGCSYMTAPQHFLASGANPHPDDVRRTHQRREGRANEEDFGTLMEYALANGTVELCQRLHAPSANTIDMLQDLQEPNSLNNNMTSDLSIENLSTFDQRSIDTDGSKLQTLIDLNGCIVKMSESIDTQEHSHYLLQ